MPESKAESKPNLYSLEGRNVTINYSLSDLSGQPSLNFKVGKLTGTAHKKDIHITEINNVGQVITVALHPGPSADEGNPQFSFLLPIVTLQSGHEAAFDTVGVETITTRQGPAHQRYTSVALKGNASVVKTLAAKN
jgi:hypothetical protein